MPEQTKADLVKILGETTMALTLTRGDLAMSEKRFNVLVDELTTWVEKTSDVRRGPTMFRAEAVREINAILMAAGARRS